MILGMIGMLVSLIGMVMVIGAVIPAVRRSQTHFVRNALVTLVGGFIMFVVGVVTEPESASSAASAAPAAPTSPQVAPLDAPPTTPADTAQASGPTTPLAGTPQEVDRWVIQGGSSDRTIVFRRSLGNEFIGTAADSGYTYALVPVFVKNNTTRTQSLSFATWLLRDDRGYEYTTETMADLYLSEQDRLDVTNIPPEATRVGYLIFQVQQGVSALTLEFGSGRNQRVWRFANL